METDGVNDSVSHATLPASASASTNILQDDTGESHARHTDDTRSTVTRERRPPPIYLTTAVKNFVDFSNQLKLSVGDNFHLKQTNKNSV